MYLIHFIEPEVAAMGDFFLNKNRGATPPGNRKHIITEEIKVNLQRGGTNALPNQRLGD
jgi:hypothetical protein